MVATPPHPGLPPRLARWWPFFYASGTRHGVDPLVIAAVCDQESAGGETLYPKGPAGTGDWEWRLDIPTGRRLRVGLFGRGRGLMQVDVRWHKEFCALELPDGRFAWQDPERNIEYAVAHVLAPAVRAFPGELHLALAAYNRGIERVRRSLRKFPKESTAPDIRATAADLGTAHDCYGASVLFRLATLTAPPRSPPSGLA